MGSKIGRNRGVSGQFLPLDVGGFVGEGLSSGTLRVRDHATFFGCSVSTFTGTGAAGNVSTTSPVDGHIGEMKLGTIS